MEKKSLAKIIAAAVCAVVGAVIAGMFITGTLRLGDPSETEYPVRGVDVSAHQGNIDWQKLSSKGISFAFIKATEGSSHADAMYEANFSGAVGAGLYVGAYHFFSFETSGEAQAENFIKHFAPIGNKMLPPVIDIEFYGGKHPKREDILPELDAMVKALEEHYGVTPVIYATRASYDEYIRHYDGEYLLWIRDVYGVPSGLDFAFWQYSDRERLDCYDGEEKCIDMNVFCGEDIGSICIKQE